MTDVIEIESNEDLKRIASDYLDNHFRIGELSKSLKEVRRQLGSYREAIVPYMKRTNVSRLNLKEGSLDLSIKKGRTRRPPMTEKAVAERLGLDAELDLDPTQIEGVLHTLFKGGEAEEAEDEFIIKVTKSD